MKIGTFARKFNMNSSAVRFYIQNGLLVPERKNGQYEFGRDCILDMENILKYKNYRFSLEEIQLLFFLEKTSRFQDRVVLEVCADMLKNKRKELIGERDHLNGCIEDLAAEIDNLPCFPEAEPSPASVPFSFIPYLYCPRCQTPLQLDAASLSGGRLHRGDLWCDCGYRAVIDDGIILCESASEDTPFKAFENVESVVSMAQQFSPGYRMLFEKANLWMYNRIEEAAQMPGHILAGPFTLNFLLKYIENLDPANTFIVADPSKKRIEKLRTYLSDLSCSVVYIAAEPRDLPVKHASVDVYMVNYMFTYDRFPASDIAPLLKGRSLVAGIFVSYASAPKSIANFKKIHPGFSPEKMTLRGLKREWASAGVSVTGEKSIGMTTGSEQHFTLQTAGEQVEVIAYAAKKAAR